MRLIITMVAVVVIGSAASTQDKPIREVVPVRFDVIPDIEIYPQDEAKQALASVIKAVEKGRFDYAVAHLLEPKAIDRRIGEAGETFAELVAAMRSKTRENPDLVRNLKLLLREGETQEGESAFTFTHKELKDRKATLVKIGQRWFLVNDRNDKK